MLKLQYVGDKCLNLSKKVTKSFLFDGTGSVLQENIRIIFIFRTPTNNGFFSGTMESEI